MSPDLTITINNCGTVVEASSYGETLDSLLNRLGIPTYGNYRVSLPLDSLTYDGMEVTVKHVIEQEETYTVEIPYEITSATYVTDDPLNSCRMLRQLQSGEEVTMLAGMGQWLYVETTVSGKTVRGFIPVTSAVPAQPEAGWNALNPNG